MYPVSFVIIFAFHPRLNLDRIVVQRTFENSLKKMTDVSYLFAHMFEPFGPITAEQLIDSAIQVSQREEKYAISEMCSTELTFASDCLMKWFERKYKRKSVEINLQCQKRFENENEIDWDEGKCVVCDFLLAVANIFRPKSTKMPYYNFVITKKHKFVRNVYDQKELKISKSLES